MSWEGVIAASDQIEIPVGGMWNGKPEDRARAERDCALAPKHCFHKNDEGSFTCCWCPAVSL